MKSRVSVLLVFALIALSAPAFAAVDAFLKLNGINGESSDPVHKGWIEIESYSWGATNASTNPGAEASCASGFIWFETAKPSESLQRACMSQTQFHDISVDVQGQRHLLQGVSFKSCPSDPSGRYGINFTRCATHAKPGAPTIKEKVKGENNASILIGNRAPQQFGLSELKIQGPNTAILIGLLQPASKGANGLIILQNNARAQTKVPSLTIETRSGKWTFTDVLISSYSAGGGGGAGAPTESFSLNFARVDGPPNGFQDLSFLKQ